MKKAFDPDTVDPKPGIEGWVKTFRPHSSELHPDTVAAIQASVDAKDALKRTKADGERRLQDLRDEIAREKSRHLAGLEVGIEAAREEIADGLAGVHKEIAALKKGVDEIKAELAMPKLVAALKKMDGVLTQLSSQMLKPKRWEPTFDDEGNIIESREVTDER